jgi:hypothetical protein
VFIIKTVVDISITTFVRLIESPSLNWCPIIDKNRFSTEVRLRSTPPALGCALPYRRSILKPSALYKSRSSWLLPHLVYRIRISRHMYWHSNCLIARVHGYIWGHYWAHRRRDGRAGDWNCGSNNCRLGVIVCIGQHIVEIRFLIPIDVCLQNYKI